MGQETGRITPGRIVWHELNTQAPEKSQAFYRELFAWRFDPGDSGYVHIYAGDEPIGGMLPSPVPELPNRWWPYVSVADVDEATAGAQIAGCRVCAGPMTIEHVGRFTALADPQGGNFCVWRSQHGDPPEVVTPARGSFCWDQLNAPDPEAAFSAYTKIFGWTRAAFPGMPGMWTLKRAERLAASLLQAPAGTPAHWLTYVLVDDLARARARAHELGGKVLVERLELAGIGTCSVLQDNLGALIAAFAEQAS